MKSENSVEARVEQLSRFKKHLKDAPLEIRTAFRDAAILFRDNQNHLSLRNHSLKGKYAGYRSISVTDDWRAHFRVIKTKRYTTIRFVALGTHKHLYK